MACPVKFSRNVGIELGHSYRTHARPVRTPPLPCPPPPLFLSTPTIRRLLSSSSSLPPAPEAPQHLLPRRLFPFSSTLSVAAENLNLSVQLLLSPALCHFSSLAQLPLPGGDPHLLFPAISSPLLLFHTAAPSPNRRSFHFGDQADLKLVVLYQKYPQQGVLRKGLTFVTRASQDDSSSHARDNGLNTTGRLLQDMTYLSSNSTKRHFRSNMSSTERPSSLLSVVSMTKNATQIHPGSGALDPASQRSKERSKAIIPNRHIRTSMVVIYTFSFFLFYVGL